MKAAAIYARVSSEQQKEENTIASQTAALIEFAREQGYGVPDEWVVEDEDSSGASLLRPGLERLRDLAAEGHIQAVLIHAPDRLSRKYAYQVLLTEEFARHGVETIFLKAPHSGTPEDQLMLQFQGMIAEYERAQILERSRRGKRHRAKAGEVSVLVTASVWLSLHSQDPRCAGSLRDRRRRSGGRAAGVRHVHGKRSEHRSDRPVIARDGAAHAAPGDPLGAIGRAGRSCATRRTKARPASTRRRSDGGKR